MFILHLFSRNSIAFTISYDCDKNIWHYWGFYCRSTRLVPISIFIYIIKGNDYSKNKFIYLRIVIIIFSLLLIILSLIYPSSDTRIMCTRETKNSVICQLKKREFYGLLNNSTVKFPLSEINIQKKSWQKCITSVRDETLEECYNHGDTMTINTYKIYLLSNNSNFLLETISNDTFIASLRNTNKYIENTKQKIENLLNGIGESSYEYEKTRYSYAISIITFFLACIALWYVKQAENKADDIQK